MPVSAFEKLSEGTSRCSQCWRVKSLSNFVGARGGIVRRCKDCRIKYGDWDKKTREEKLASRAQPLEAVKGSEVRVRFVARSGNKKLGPIPATMTGRASCPPSCGFYGAGCYGEYSFLAWHWKKTPEEGIGWNEFCERVSSLPKGQLWRHNEVGDLPGKGNAIHLERMFELVQANHFARARGFTFSHKPVLGATATARRNRDAIRQANDLGFTVNLSADGLEHADKLLELGIAPVAAVVPTDAPRGLRTPKGAHVVLCPAETHGLSCSECELCAKPWRKSVVAFRAHGQSKKIVSELVQLRKKSL